MTKKILLVLAVLWGVLIGTGCSRPIEKQSEERAEENKKNIVEYDCRISYLESGLERSAPCEVIEKNLRLETSD